MKKMSVTAIVVLVFVFLLQTKSSGEIPDVESQIREATHMLLGNAASQEELVQALAQLIDCAAILSAESKYTAEIKTQLDIAKTEITQKSLFSDKGRQKLAFAYRMFTEGTQYRPPEELDDFVTPQQATEKARKYVERLVDNTLKDYKAGNHLQAAQNLVELVLMIITPIEGS